MRRFIYSFLVLTGIVLSFSCNRTSLVGSELFVPESIDLFFEDDFEIRAKTVKVDSSITFDLFSSLNTTIIGVLDDPVFGKTIAESYIDLHLGSIAPEFAYELDGTIKSVELDSAVLILGYRPEAFYGDSTASHDVIVDILEYKLTFKDTVYSTFKPEPRRLIARNSLVPNYQDSVSVVEPGDSTATEYEEQFRIRIDYNFIQETIEDTSLISDDTRFTAYAPGLRISSTPDKSSLWGINHSKVSEYPYNSILVYYKQEDELKTYRIFADGERHMYIRHDYEGSLVEEFFDDFEKGDSLLFLQGLAGTEVELEIPILSDNSFDDYVINKAELEFYVVSDTDDEEYPPIEGIILERYTEDGQLIVTEDVFLAFEALATNVFDGKLTEVVKDGQTVKKYSAAMSVHTLRMFNTENPDIRIRIKADNKVERPNRTVIFGPGHSTYPMKFKLTYSK